MMTELVIAIKTKVDEVYSNLSKETLSKDNPLESTEEETDNENCKTGSNDPNCPYTSWWD